MNLDKNSLICGYPASLIRKVFQRIQGYQVYAQFFSHQMKIKRKDAAILVSALAEEGYLERNIPSFGEERFSITIKGNSLAMASLAPPISRQTANKKVSELLERVKIVNTSDEFLYKVKRVAIFGSYLTDKARINDVDVDIILQEKHPRNTQLAKENACIQKASDQGKEFRNYTDQLFYPQNLTRKFLKHRSRALSLHYGDDILTQTEYKIVYELEGE